MESTVVTAMRPVCRYVFSQFSILVMDLYLIYYLKFMKTCTTPSLQITAQPVNGLMLMMRSSTIQTRIAMAHSLPLPANIYYHINRTKILYISRYKKCVTELVFTFVFVCCSSAINCVHTLR